MTKLINYLGRVASIVVALGAMGSQAMALTVDGAIYSLDTTELSTTNHNFTLTIDLSGYTGGGSFLSSLAFNLGSPLFDSSMNYLPGVSFSLLSTPDALSNWSVAPGGLNASGCNSTGTSWVCMQDTANSGYGYNILPLASHSNVQFTFNFTGVALTGSGLSLKAYYTDTNGNKTGSLISLPVSPIPEPETYAMLLAGLGLIGIIARRKGHKDRMNFT